MDNLSYFLAAYFHEDWDHYGPTWQSVVDAFIEDDAETVAAVPSEIDALLKCSPDDKQLGQTLLELGCVYDPPEGDRTWLVAVRDRIRSRV